MFTYLLRWVLVFFALDLLSSATFGQIQPVAHFRGELLPIMACRENYFIVVKDGDKRDSDGLAYEVHPNASFGEGFVEISGVQSDLNPLKNVSANERARPNAVHFKYQAVLTADRSMSSCYAMVTFITQGSVGTKMIPIGSLGKNSPRTIKLELPDQVDLVGTVHVFCNGLEVRTSDHRDAYNFNEYYGALMKNFKGLSAAELLKGEREYPHKLSLDGQKLASIRARNGKNILIVYDLQSMKLLCEYPLGADYSSINDITWISDHEFAYVSEGELHAFLRHKLYLFDVSAQQASELLDDVDNIEQGVLDRPEILIIKAGDYQEGNWFEKYDVRRRKAFDLENPDSGNYYWDRQGNTRIQIYNDGDKVTYLVRPTPDARWRELDSIVKQPGLHFNLRGAELLDRTADLLGLGPDGDTLYISTRVNDEHFEIDAFSMSKGVISGTIAKHPKYDLTTSDYNLGDLLFAKDSTRLKGLVFEAQKPQVIWFDPKFAAVQKAIDAQFPDHTNWPVDWSKDGNSFIYLSSSDRDPGTYYVFRPQEGKLIPVFERGEHLKDKQLSKTLSTEFTARDGQKIPAYITRPLDAKGACPLLVIVHGGPMARDHWGFSADNQFFASRGYIVLQVNYRGSSGYGAKFQAAGLRARLDTVVLDDIADGVRSLIASGEVDPARVAIMGGSFGGWATYMSLIKYPDIYKAGIAIAAVSHWRQAIKDDRWVFGNEMGSAFWKSLLSRASFDEDEKFIDPYVRHNELHAPILIVHGERDNVVRATETKLMLEGLKKHNQNVHSISFPYATHTYWPFDDSVVLLNESASFLDQYIGAGVTSPPPTVASVTAP